MMGRSASTAPDAPVVSVENDSESALGGSSRDSLPRRTSGARPGGRSERVVRDILTATAVELAQCGYAKLGFDEVAARAGVAKTTIYRRWSTKAQLVTAALRALRGEETGGTEDGDANPGASEAARAEVDTGSVRGDLRELLRAHVSMTTTPIGMSIMRMLSVELDNPEVEAIARALRAERRAPFLAAVERGIARGEISPGVDPTLIVEVLVGTCVTRIGKFREVVDAAYTERLLDLVLYGAATGREC